MKQASDSDSEEEVPPPLPPPRTESLKKEVTTFLTMITHLKRKKLTNDEQNVGGYGWR